VFGLTDIQWQELLLSVNTHRKTRRLSPVETATHLDIALSKTDLHSLAQALGFSDTTTIVKIRRLKDLPAELGALVEWGTANGSVSMSTAAELMRIPSIEVAADAIKAAVEHSLNKEEARQLVQILERSKDPLETCLNKVLLTRPRVEQSELIVGSLLSPMAQEKVLRVGAEPAAKKLRLLLAKNFPSILCQSVRIRDGRFSLLFPDTNGTELRKLLRGVSVETTVTRLLEQLQIEGQQ
jgi:hypothetical protein